MKYPYQNNTVGFTELIANMSKFYYTFCSSIVYQYSYVTGFAKTNPNCATIKIQFIG